MIKKKCKSNITKPTKFTCICGHRDELHSYWDNYKVWTTPTGHCEVWIHIDEELLGIRCKCQHYKQDNLKYIEDCCVNNDKTIRKTL